MNIECNYIIPHHEYEKCELKFMASHTNEATVRISVAGSKVTLTVDELEEIVRLSQLFDHASQMMADAKNNAIIKECLWPLGTTQ